MRSLLSAVLVLCLGVLPGCGLFGGMPGDRGPTPDYFSVSPRVEPLWQGWRDDSIPHLRLRLWLIDAAEEASVRNTYDPAVKIVVLKGDLRDDLMPGIELVDSGGYPSPQVRGLLIQRDDEQGRPGVRVDGLLFEGAHDIRPAGEDHYCIFYGERGTQPVLWSEADSFRPIGLTTLRLWSSIAVIPGEAIVASTPEGLVALDWDCNPMPDPGWDPGLDASAVYPVLGDSAVLFGHRGSDGPRPLKEGAYLWRPGQSGGDGPHRVVPYQEGYVEGPGNAYFGFESNRDRISKLVWPEGERPTARRVLNVPGLFRTASSMSPDGRFVVSGDPGFKVDRNDARIHEVHENGERLWRRVGDPGRGLRPVWLHKRFGAPESVTIVPRP